MSEHNLFYYPYAYFSGAQLPLLKVAALYFDKLYLLDPVGASWNGVGVDWSVVEAVRLLKGVGVLEIVDPASVLATYEAAITEAIRRDMDDNDFFTLCERQSRATGKLQWTLSLAKVPQDVQTDRVLSHLMGDFSRAVAHDAGNYREQMGGDPTEFREYAATGQPFDGYNEGYQGAVAYRHKDFPLALGESIMMNHALFSGLLHLDATPITDESFHNQALSLKLRRSLQEPAVQQMRDDRARARRVKTDLLATAAFTDSQLRLPILSPKMSLDDILTYREKHDDDLQQARQTLGKMARSIEAEPWSEEFVSEIECKTIPDVQEELEKVRKARDAWLRSTRRRLIVSGSGAAVAAATAVLTVFAAPLTPVALATLGLSLVSGIAVPGAERLLDWREGKESVQDNGLHYFLRV